jgi:hypothetical protein
MFWKKKVQYNPVDKSSKGTSRKVFSPYKVNPKSNNIIVHWIEDVLSLLSNTQPRY